MNSFINPFVPNAPFLHLITASENLRFSDVFKGQKNDALGANGLRMSLVNVKKSAAEDVLAHMYQINPKSLTEKFAHTAMEK